MASAVNWMANGLVIQWIKGLDRSGFRRRVAKYSDKADKLAGTDFFGCLSMCMGDLKYMI